MALNTGTVSEKLQRVVKDLEALSSGRTSDRMLQTAGVADRFQEALADGGVLAEVAHRVAEFAADRGCDVIMGASPIGERVAGAAVAISKNGLRGASPDCRGKRILVVDGLYVTGSQLERATERALMSKPTSVFAAAILSAVPDPRIGTKPATPVSVIGV